jgi:hypothetical protein
MMLRHFLTFWDFVQTAQCKKVQVVEETLLSSTDFLILNWEIVMLSSVKLVDEQIGHSP